MKLVEISRQLTEVYEGNPWFGKTLSTYLQEIKPDALSTRMNEGHSIGQIISHMIEWRKFVILKLQNKPTSQEVGTPQDWTDHAFTTEDKTQLYTELKETQKTLIHILSVAQDELLEQTVPGEAYSFEHLLVGIIQHDIYHLGQIYLLKSSMTS